MKRKEARSSVRWSDKTLHVLKLLGYIDGRNNTVKDKSKNMSNMINIAVQTLLCKGNTDAQVYENFYKEQIIEERRNIEASEDKIHLHVERVRRLREEGAEKIKKEVDVMEMSTQ